MCAVTLTCWIQPIPEQILDLFFKVMVKCTIIVITSTTFTNPESFIVKHSALIFTKAKGLYLNLCKYDKLFFDSVVTITGNMAKVK
jgi:flagellar biosynthesis component FlhA